MDIGSITIVLILGLLFLIAIGKPLGLASAVVALVVMILKFEPTLLTFPFEYVGSLFTAPEAPDKWFYPGTQWPMRRASAGLWPRRRTRLMSFATLCRLIWRTRSTSHLGLP